MTTKNMHQLLAMLDSCIDRAEQAEVLLALNFFRRMLLKFWQDDNCRMINAAALLVELTNLAALCLKGAWHPALPLALCRVVIRLCTPALASREEIRAQCWHHAELIRLLRAWLPLLEAVLMHYDAQTRQEVCQVVMDEENMLNEVFDQYLTLCRSCIDQENRQRRQRHMAQIEACRQELSLPEVMEQMTRIDVNRKVLKEKLLLCTAEID